MIVDIDESQLDAELDALLARLPPDPVSGDYIPVGQSWKDTLRKYHVVEGAREKFFASWNFPDDFNEDATVCFGDIGDRVWPGGVQLADTWGPWGKLCFLMGSVVLMNMDKVLAPFMAPEPPATPPPAQQPPQQESPDGATGP